MDIHIEHVCATHAWPDIV